MVSCYIARPRWRPPRARLRWRAAAAVAPGSARSLSSSLLLLSSEAHEAARPVRAASGVPDGAIARRRRGHGAAPQHCATSMPSLFVSVAATAVSLGTSECAVTSLVEGWRSRNRIVSSRRKKERQPEQDQNDVNRRNGSAAATTPEQDTAIQPRRFQVSAVDSYCTSS